MSVYLCVFMCISGSKIGVALMMLDSLHRCCGT